MTEQKTLTYLKGCPDCKADGKSKCIQFSELHDWLNVRVAELQIGIQNTKDIIRGYEVLVHKEMNKEKTDYSKISTWAKKKDINKVKLIEDKARLDELQKLTGKQKRFFPSGLKVGEIEKLMEPDQE